MFSNLNSNCSNLLDMRNLQEQVKKAFCYQKLFWPFTAWINCSNDIKKFANSRPSALNFKSFSRSKEFFFLTVGQNNFGNKIPFLIISQKYGPLQICLHLKKSDLTPKKHWSHCETHGLLAVRKSVMWTSSSLSWPHSG